MFVQFKVSNFRSIGKEQILSLLPAKNQKEYPGNILQDGEHEALNVVAIYGANGSGKSNLMSALAEYVTFITESSRYSSRTKIPWQPFFLKLGLLDQPTAFEGVFVIDGVRYRYGFEYNEKEIIKEWLYRKGAGREVAVFLREGDVVEPSSSLKANSKIIDAAIDATKPNSLFLSVSDTLNITEAVSIMTFFTYFVSVDGNRVKDFESSVIGLWDNVQFRKDAIDYMARMGSGIAGIELKKQTDHLRPQQIINSSESNPVIESAVLYSFHHVYDRNGKKTKEQISWRFEDMESSGTNKALMMTGPILFVLKHGGVIVIDEIETNMHPVMTLDTITMFLDPNINKMGAQLILTTHDTNLLTYAKLRRDQIYFAEKNAWESTEIYSLSDFTYASDIPGPMKERSDTDKEKRYLEGRYGGVPTLGKPPHLVMEDNNG